MPIAVKDVIETADMPTGQGSPMWEGTATRRDSAAVRALREAGGVILGKTTTTEFAATHPWHKTQNPHDGTRTPGGSSSGSAAAVGSGMVPAALGTQVVGSILRPASFCGCVGYKPSVGGVNRSGSYDHFSQSCQGAIGATLADVWGHHHGHGTHRRRSRPFGVSGTVNFTKPGKPKRLAHPGNRRLERHHRGRAPGVRRREGKARRDRHRDEIARRRPGPGSSREASHRRPAADPSINAFEGRWPLNTYAALDAGKLSQPAHDRLKTANAMTQRDYAELLKRRDAARAAYAKAASKYDAFVTLGACGAAPKGLGSTGNTIMNVAASLLGCPAITLPLLSDESLPLGLQLMGGVEPRCGAVRHGGLGASAAFNRSDLIGSLEP